MQSNSSEALEFGLKFDYTRTLFIWLHSACVSEMDEQCLN